MVVQFPWSSHKKQSFEDRALKVWMKWYRSLFFLIFFGVGVWSSLLWHRSMSFEWNESQKQEYKEQQSRRVKLKEKELEQVLRVTEKQRSEYLNESPRVKDIFSDIR